eukprot:11173849-Lingulodinium_polyedra.AAC.1
MEVGDQEVPLGDVAEEAAEEEPLGVLADSGTKECKRYFIVDLWPFVCSIDYYKRLFTHVGE